MEYNQIELIQTCGACPEQYDAFFNGEKVGYLRLRHGFFRVENQNGDTIYEANPDGDGCFTSNESEFYLDEAQKAIWNSLHPVKYNILSEENMYDAYSRGAADRESMRTIENISINGLRTLIQFKN